eukprot:TRINITY_DN4342_c0_g1_i1.p1 TRINITY_DN4342_c0_g1~~TRINITY_DN4342_c0_g1_i1.p1  ORF type:complete len:467 (+),score=104.34 TRINITY_DN4342_c0_g1_i1:58-1458(+)
MALNIENIDPNSPLLRGIERQSQCGTKFVPNTQAKVNEFFLMWLQLEETQDFLQRISTPSWVKKPSPSKKNVSNIKLETKDDPKPSNSKETKSQKKEMRKEHIPKITLESHSSSPEDVEAELTILKAGFSKYPRGLNIDHFVLLMDEACAWPAFVSTATFKKIVTTDKNYLESTRFFAYWRLEMQNFDDETRIFNLLKKEKSRRDLTPDDFRDLLGEIMMAHPGLAFLKATPEFQERYCETVIVRIFFCMSRLRRGKISLKEFKNYRFYDVLRELDTETDVNNVIDFFSYDHFYLIYCKFWELDKDHDLKLSADDLHLYAESSLNQKIIQRILEQSPLTSEHHEKGKISYQHFVWFFLAEEDKTHPTSQEYWFRCIDCDGDGVLSTFEIQQFYDLQIQMMQLRSIEHLIFQDYFCQMVDIIKPADSKRITIQDIRNCKNGAYFFDSLVNVNKYVGTEECANEEEDE